MIGLVSLLFAFLFFLGLYAGLSVYLQRRREVSQRIQQYAGYQPAAVRKTPFWEILRNRFHELFAERNRRPGRPWNRKKLDLMMIQAGLPLLGKEYVAIAGGLAVLVFLVTAVAGRSLVTGLLGGILTVFGAVIFLQRRISRRKEAFERQLADCLTLVSNSLRAGFSFLQTMEIISREMQPPMSTEFANVMRNTSLGRTMEDALQEMDQRVGNEDFSLVITAVLIQQQVGGNLATILDTIRETISERIRLRREVGTLTAQGKFSGLVLTCIPIGLGLFFAVASPEYLRPLLTTSIGKMAIGAAVVMEIIGYLIISRIVDIKI
ncbi:MAG: type II secretion system F family protein [Acidaminococcus fermentans]|uniref:type II secretion system F family protein n=1 Tax=Acidaminococcus fermentans TaxID=905 RepID=UPI00242DF656|nr:type II secretion system F family protein [Acidaminococcus fermentans]MDD7196016.1 type II secretion system F family protein [Acidaminococcus fermentans]MDY2853262.1 type II secretion system F family protein [Acidaminococcus fermentans]